MPMPSDNSFSAVIKVHILPRAEDIPKFERTMEQYRQGCNHVSKYMFEHDFDMNQNSLNKVLYGTLRDTYALKSQMAQSCLRNVVARYKTVRTQLRQNPYKYKVVQENEKPKYIYVQRDLDWLWEPIYFKRPQYDLVRGRDWSYLKSEDKLSLNTLDGRVKVSYICKGFDQYFDGTWQFGLAKLLKANGKWYLHIAASKEIPDFNYLEQTHHVVGIDRGLRFLSAVYDEKGKTTFTSGKAIMHKRDKFQSVRDKLQSKGTKSAKRALKRISGRENRWMSDINHQISKTLVDTYGSGTVYTVEDLAGVSFDLDNENSAKSRKDKRSWAFYQLEEYLTYKAKMTGSTVIKVPAEYTSQRCPKCGTIRKENRDHNKHLYTCCNCGYRSNDDRIGAMNIYELGKRYISGQTAPKFEKIEIPVQV